MSETTDNLKQGRAVAWATLIPAFNHAIVLAVEAEFIAARVSDQAMTNIAPAYPPLVGLLANAGELSSDRTLAELRERLAR